MSFRIASIFTTILFAALALSLFWFPEVVYWLFGLTENPLGNFLARRAAILFTALSVLSFLSRSTKSHEVKRYVSASIGIGMGLMATLGLYEWLTGGAGPGILLAICIELVLAAVYFQLYHNSSKTY